MNVRRFVIAALLTVAALAQAQQPVAGGLFIDMSPDEVGERASSLLAGIQADITAIEH